MVSGGIEYKMCTVGFLGALVSIRPTGTMSDVSVISYLLKNFFTSNSHKYVAFHVVLQRRQSLQLRALVIDRKRLEADSAYQVEACDH